jgi:hypothetical protein
MKAWFPTLLLAFSCTKYASFDRDAVGVHLRPVEMEISHLNEIRWNVGMRREREVSQSFTFIVDLPRVGEEDLDYLTKEKGVDAWILRLIATHGADAQDLGSLYAPFRPRRLGRRGMDSNAPKSVTFKVFYAAAFASERFRGFKCPAFGHNRKITDLAILGENREFSITLGPEMPYPEKTQLVELQPSSFNGGNGLTGEYFVEIAPYNSVKKTVLATFKRLPMSVAVRGEKAVRVGSCDGVLLELK